MNNTEIKNDTLPVVTRKLQVKVAAAMTQDLTLLPEPEHSIVNYLNNAIYNAKDFQFV